MMMMMMMMMTFKGILNCEKLEKFENPSLKFVTLKDRNINDLSEESYNELQKLTA